MRFVTAEKTGFWTTLGHKLVVDTRSLTIAAAFIAGTRSMRVFACGTQFTCGSTILFHVSEPPAIFLTITRPALAFLILVNTRAVFGPFGGYGHVTQVAGPSTIGQHFIVSRPVTLPCNVSCVALDVVSSILTVAVLPIYWGQCEHSQDKRDGKHLFLGCSTDQLWPHQIGNH